MKIPLFKRTFPAILFCLFGLQSLYATHIIGGEMNYRCLGNNQYEISLTVYRDCYLGEALMDDTAYVAVYDVNSTLVATLPILLRKIDTIFQVDECLIIPPNICVETTTYVDTIELEFRRGGYHIAYQRCCRNATILNINNPLATGATYDIVLTEEAMRVCNSSPKIKDWPPTFICVNRPIYFDHSATDLDGDSVAYKLCTPLTGGIYITNPRPRPSFPPPYLDISWKSPRYGIHNMLGGESLKIDPQTGILTGIPNTIGQFVVGVCVEEYRNGKLISETRRDFQYYVVPCEDVVAQFEAPDRQCDNLTVEFENTTPGETDNFLWKFFDPAQPGAISREVNPTFTFSDTGTYTVRLIVNRGKICVDSLDKTIYLTNNTLSADFGYDILNCIDSLVFQLRDHSQDSAAQISEWLWTINGEKDTIISTEQHPVITIKNSQMLNINLQVQSGNNCVQEQNGTLNALIIPDSFSISTFDTLVVCRGDSIELNSVYNPNLMYFWSPPNGLSDINAPNPKAFPDTSTAYLLIIKDSLSNCEIRRNVFLEVLDVDTTFDFAINLLECGDSLQVQIKVDSNYNLNGKTFSWLISEDGQSQTSEAINPFFTLKNQPIINVVGTVTDENGCVLQRSRSLNIDFIEEAIIPVFNVCKGEFFEINPDFNSDYTYQWGPANLFDNPASPNPNIVVDTSTIVSVEISNRDGTCRINRTVALNVLNEFQTVDFQFKIADCLDSLTLEISEVNIFPNDTTAEFLWELSGEQESAISTDELPVFILKESQLVNLTLTLNPEGECPETTIKSLKVSPLKDIRLEDSITICQGETVFLNPDEAFSEYSYQWLPAEDLNNATAINPTASPQSTTDYQLIYSDSAGQCQIEKNIKVVVLNKLPDLEVEALPDCDGRTVDFVPNVSAALLWNFGDGSPEVETNSDASFSYIYQEGGTYSISAKLIAAGVCADSTNLNITLPDDKNVVADFSWNVQACENNVAQLELVDKSRAVIGTITDWSWQLSNNLSSIEQNPLLSVNTVGELIVDLKITIDSDSNCVDTTSKLLPPLLVEEGLEDSLFACFGESLALNHEFNTAYTYNWTLAEGLSDPSAPNPSIVMESANWYLVEVSNEFGCTFIDSVFANVAPEIVIETLPPLVACDTSQQVLLAESEQAVQQWWLNEMGDTLGFEPEIMVGVEESSNFTAVVEDKYGCTNSETLLISYQAIELAYEKNQNTCLGEQTTLLIENLRPENALKFDWQPSADIISGGDTRSPIIELEETTVFTFTASNEFGCEWTDQIEVTVNEIPMVEVAAMPDTTYEGEPVQLNATENPDYTYNWSPANSLNDPTIANPLATPSVTTTYTVQVTNQANCTNEASLTIFVNPTFCEEPYIFVPSAFTPNGDGENDVLYVRGVFIDELEFIIYDRWGDKVFETRSQEIGWDGTRNGKQLSSGVFGYYLRVVCSNGEIFRKQGNITLIL